MEHFRLAAGAGLTEHDQVPYIASDDYKDVPFAEYPERTGKQYLLALACRNEGPEDLDEDLEQEIASFIQTWLFFCLLQQFLGPYFVPEDFVELRVQPDGMQKPFLTTLTLFDALLRRNENPVDQPLSFEELQKIDLALTEGRDTLTYRENLRPLVISISSILSLLPAITTGTNYSFTQTLMSVEIPFSIDIELMKEQGWCRYEASRHWQSANSVDSQMLLRTSRRHDARDHGRCEKTFCTYRQGSLDSYVVSHTSDHCTCQMFSVPMDQSRRMIENGRLVLLEVDTAATKPEDMFRAVSSAPGEPYIAISHIWLDGLGNPDANALPLCRLLDLSKRVQELMMHCSRGQAATNPSSRFRIWIDTLCCPVGPVHVKRMSLAAMADTYRSAERVLVLDANLQLLPSKKMHIVEAGVYIAHSDWMLRLWCFQEGGLARKLHFRFQDGMLDLDTFSESNLAPYGSSPKLHGLVEDVTSRLAPFFRIYTETFWSDSLETIHKAVSFRDVTVPSDEAICLNAMIGQRPIGADSVGEENMRDFWAACADAGLLYADHLFHQFPCMTSRGSRWAPKTLRIDPTLTLYSPFPTTNYVRDIKLTPSGALVNMEGLVMNSSCRNNDTSLFASSKGDDWWMLARMPQTGTYYLFVFDQYWLPCARERLISASNIGAMILTHGDLSSTVVGYVILGIVHERSETVNFERLICGCCFLLPTLLNEKIEWIISDTESAVRDVIENEQNWRDFFLCWPIYKRPDPERLLSMTFKPILDLRDGFDFEITEYLPQSQAWLVD